MKRLIKLMKQFEELSGERISFAFDSDEMGAIERLQNGHQHTFYDLDNAEQILKSMIAAQKASPENLFGG